MKKGFYIFLVLLSLSTVAQSQNGQKTIIEDLNTPKGGRQGNILIMQDESIQHLVGIYHEGNATSAIGGANSDGSVDLSANLVKVKGFKIQVFSGNNQSRSKQEAESKRAMMRNSYPDLEAVITYNAPLWRLRVGNFLNREDAERVLSEMKKTFPSFAGEMHVVSDIVKRVAQ